MLQFESDIGVRIKERLNITNQFEMCCIIDAVWYMVYIIHREEEAKWAKSKRGKKKLRLPFSNN